MPLLWDEKIVAETESRSKQFQKTVKYKECHLGFSEKSKIDFGGFACYYLEDLFHPEHGIQINPAGNLVIDAGGRNHGVFESVQIKIKDILGLYGVDFYLKYLQNKSNEPKQEEVIPELNKWFYLTIPEAEHETLINLGDIAALDYQLPELSWYENDPEPDPTICRIYLKGSSFFEVPMTISIYNALVSDWIAYSNSKSKMILSFPSFGIAIDSTVMAMVTFKDPISKMIISFKNGKYLSRVMLKTDYHDLVNMINQVVNVGLCPTSIDLK